jgi:hypothetical protein
MYYIKVTIVTLDNWHVAGTSTMAFKKCGISRIKYLGAAGVTLPQQH